MHPWLVQFPFRDGSGDPLAQGASLARKALAVAVVFPLVFCLATAGFAKLFVDDHEEKLRIGQQGVPVTAVVVDRRVQTTRSSGSRSSTTYHVTLAYRVGEGPEVHSEESVGADEYASLPMGAPRLLLVLPTDPRVFATPADVATAQHTPLFEVYSQAALAGMCIGSVVAFLVAFARPRRRATFTFPWRPR